MSANNSKPNDSLPKENTTNTLKDHLRAFEYAKMERIVHSNTDTSAGDAIRRRSSSVQADRSSDRTPLVPKKPHWTTEERWQGIEAESGEAWEHRMRMIAAEEKQGEEGPGMASARKGSAGSKAGEMALEAVTGYVRKPDQFGRYPV